MDSQDLFIEIFGEQSEEFYLRQCGYLDEKMLNLQELKNLRERASNAFKVHLTFPDIAVSAGAGVLLGIGNALFKNFIPKHGMLKHVHNTTRVAVDYQVPKAIRYDLHRQIGPGHDIFRFKEALSLMSGKSTDFKLWGKTATKILGHELRPMGGLTLQEFRATGGFRIPEDPKKELINHLLIDFFTKHSDP